MPKSLILALLLSNSMFSFTQSNLNIHQYKVADFVIAEKESGGELYLKDAQFVSGPGVAQPIIYRRSQQNLPDLLTYFYFYEKDSSVSYILYEWDDQNFSNKRLSDKIPYSKMQSLIDQYHNLHNQLVLKYGEGNYKNEELDSLIIETNGVSREEVWHPNDSTEIELQMSLSNKYEHHGAITIAPTAKIRLYIQNVEKSRQGADQNLDIAKLAIIDSSYREFMNDVWLKKTDEAKKILNEAVKEKVSDQQLLELGKIIRNEPLEIYLSGYQLMQNGTQAVMLQYKYKAETKTPPRELIKVIFDSNNKILGVRPIKMLD